MATISVKRERFEIWQGQDFVKTIAITDESGRAVDLTGFGGEAQLRAGFKDDSPVLAQCDVVLVPAAWVDAEGNDGWSAQVRLSRAQTAALNPSNLPSGNGRIDCWIDNSVQRSPFAVGGVRLRQAVSEDS